MGMSMNRWITSAIWVGLMLIVWSLFVPRPVSVTTFFLFGATGLIVTVFGAMFLNDSQPPRSVNAILSELEARPTDDSASRHNR